MGIVFSCVLIGRCMCHARFAAVFIFFVFRFLCACAIRFLTFILPVCHTVCLKYCCFNRFWCGAFLDYYYADSSSIACDILGAGHNDK